jgi:hypothetical protein
VEDGLEAFLMKDERPPLPEWGGGPLLTDAVREGGARRRGDTVGDPEDYGGAAEEDPLTLLVLLDGSLGWILRGTYGSCIESFLKFSLLTISTIFII